MIKAGWHIDTRIHGVVLEQPSFQYEIGTGNPAAGMTERALIRFQGSSERILPKPKSPKVAPEDLLLPEPLRRLEPAEITFAIDGCWLRVEAYDDFAVDDALERRFRESPTDHVEAINQVLGARLASELRPRAELATGELAAIGNGVLEVWVSAPVFYYDTSHFVAGPSAVTRRSRVTTATAVEIDRSARMTLAVLKLQAGQRRKFGQATYWYLQASQQRPGSIEQFVDLFLCLEAMTYLADTRPTPADVAHMDALAEFAIGVGGALEAFVNRLRGRCLAPSLVDLFRRLATALESPTLDEDVALFAQLRKVRNNLLHGGTSAIPAEILGQETFMAITDLSQRYLIALSSVAEWEATGNIHVLDGIS